MTFRPRIWFPIATALSGLNLGAVWFAAGEPMHATVHAALAVAFGLWAVRLRSGMGGGELQARLEQVEAEMARVEGLEGEMGSLRQELSEAQERIDFAERVLTQGQEARRADPQP